MDEKRALLRHFLGALAYRTQKAVRGAPPGFAGFCAGSQVRTPIALVQHMTGVLGYARTKFRGGSYELDSLHGFAEEIERFHRMLEDLSDHLSAGDPFVDTTPERLLQGPFSDAMTHAGQLAMLRRLYGAPVPPENFHVADVDASNLSAEQPEPKGPDKEWPEAPDIA